MSDQEKELELKAQATINQRLTASKLTDDEMRFLFKNRERLTLHELARIINRSHTYVHMILIGQRQAERTKNLGLRRD